MIGKCRAGGLWLPELCARGLRPGSGANERFVEQWYYEPGLGAFQTFAGIRLVNIETVTRL